MVKQAQQTTTLQQGEVHLSLARAEGEASALRSRVSHLDSELSSYLYIFHTQIEQYKMKEIFFLNTIYISFIFLFDLLKDIKMHIEILFQW